jgi:hypothetical protein
MMLAVVGMGMVSPAGRSAREAAFFVRAGLPSPTPSPFRLVVDDRTLSARFCPWIGARAPIAERLGRLAGDALEEAMRPWAAEMGRPLPIVVCAGRPRPGLRPADLAALEAELHRRFAPPSLDREPGEAGIFAALARAAASAGGAVAIVAVDSFIDEEALLAIATGARTTWMMDQLDPGEGAAAVVVMAADQARRMRLPVLGRVHGAAVAPGASHDDNDEQPDGAALSAVLRALPNLRTRFTFGQFGTDALRTREWQLAAARNAARLGDEIDVFGLEGEIGLGGAAIGAMNLVLGLAAHRHGTLGPAAPRGGPFLAWAMARDGVRGAAICAAEDS